MSDATPDRTSPAPASRGSDWAAETADLIERTVGNVRERVVEPAERAARVVVLGVLVGLVATAMLVLVLIGLFHGLVILANLATPGPDDNAWIAWLVLGGIMWAGGAFMWSKRPARR